RNPNLEGCRYSGLSARPLARDGVLPRNTPLQTSQTMKISSPSIITAVSISWVVLATTSALAATFVVTNTADSGSGTLRSALASATNGDTVNATGVSGTILLTSGELVVSNSVTILGPGPGLLAVNGNSAGRVFHICSNLVVTISGLTIT